MKGVIRLVNVGLFLKVLFLVVLCWAYFLGSVTTMLKSTWAKEGEKAQELADNISATQGTGPPIDLHALEINERVKSVIIAQLRRLRQRQEELDQRERDLRQLKKEIDERLSRLKTMEESLKGPLAKAKKAGEERFMHLVGVYSSMEPQRAALLLEKMDEDTVVRLFSAMKSKKVAKILSYMEEDKAARISARLSSPAPALP